MTAIWTPDDLRRIGSADELQIAARRADGTLRRWLPIWVVCVSDQVYVRTWYRRNTGWFGHVLDSHRACIRVPGLQADVTVEDVAAGPDQLRVDIDAAYRAKSRNGPEYTLFISADALLPHGLSIDVAVDQVQNLLQLSQERRVTVRLVAADQQQLGAVDGFAFFHLGRGQGSTVVMKSWPCNVYFSSPSQLLRYRRIARDLDQIALSATESFAAMQQFVSKLDTRVRDLAC